MKRGIPAERAEPSSSGSSHEFSENPAHFQRDPVGLGVHFGGYVERNSFSPNPFEQGPVFRGHRQLKIDGPLPIVRCVGDVIAVVGTEQSCGRRIDRLMAEADRQHRVLPRVVDAEVNMVRCGVDEQIFALDDAGLGRASMRIRQSLGAVCVAHGETQAVSFQFVVGYYTIVCGSERSQVQEGEVALVEEVVGHLCGTGLPIERWKRAVHKRRIVVFGYLGKIAEGGLRSDPDEPEMVGHPVGGPAVRSRRYRQRRRLSRDFYTPSIGSESIAVVGTLKCSVDNASGRQW